MIWDLRKINAWKNGGGFYLSQILLILIWWYLQEAKIHTNKTPREARPKILRKINAWKNRGGFYLSQILKGGFNSMSAVVCADIHYFSNIYFETIFVSTDSDMNMPGCREPRITLQACRGNMRDHLNIMNGNTPLHTATCTGNSDCVRKLLRWHSWFNPFTVVFHNIIHKLARRSLQRLKLTLKVRTCMERPLWACHGERISSSYSRKPCESKSDEEIKTLYQCYYSYQRFPRYTLCFRKGWSL